MLDGGIPVFPPTALDDSAVVAEIVCLDGYCSDADLEEVVEEFDALEEEEEGMAADEFRMYEFKVRQCARGRSHDWTQCPYAHPGEKARRRDPRRYHYSGSPCPEFRKGACRKGDSCEFAHGVFECWLHPSRYRTQPCKDGVGCRRRVCFFAHVPEELRVLPSVAPAYDGSPLRKQARTASGGVALFPTSNLAGPLSPTGSSGVGSPTEIEEVMMEMTNLHLRKKAGMGWDWRRPRLQRVGCEYDVRTAGFDGWRARPAPERPDNASTALEVSSVDEPAWFSDIVN